MKIAAEKIIEEPLALITVKKIVILIKVKKGITLHNLISTFTNYYNFVFLLRYV